MLKQKWEPENGKLQVCPFCKEYFCGTEIYEEKVPHGKSTKDMAYQTFCYECRSRGPIARTEEMADRAFFGHPIIQLWRVFCREFPDFLGKIITWDIDYRRFHDTKLFYGIKISRVLTIEESLMLWLKDKFSKE